MIRNIGFLGAASRPSVTDLFNGFQTGGTYTGGPAVVTDNLGALTTSPANVLAVQGGRLSYDGFYGVQSMPSGFTPTLPCTFTRGSSGTITHDMDFLSTPEGLRYMSIWCQGAIQQVMVRRPRLIKQSQKR